MISSKQKVFMDSKDYICSEYDNKFRNYIPLDFKEYIDIVFSIAEQGGILDQIKQIVECNNGIAAYDFTDGTLYYSYDGIVNEAHKLASLFHDKSLTESFPELSTLTGNELINNTIISSILHELTHIMQLTYEPKSESEQTLCQIYDDMSGKQGLLDYFKNIIVYKLYYYMLPFEREALVNQLYSHTITSVNDDNRFFLMRCFLLDSTCTKGYEKNYPFQKISQIYRPNYNKDELDLEISRMDTLTKMTYGFQINDEERNMKDSNQNELIYRLHNSFYR